MGAAEAARSPAVSVVVLTWNRQALLRETLDSILAQDFGDLEALVVDNESTDGTQEYVTSHPDPRVRYLRHANGGNLAVNRNFGVANARGAWVAFCDDDDLWDPTKLSSQMRDVDAAGEPRPSVSCTNAVYFTESADVGLLVRRRGSRDVTLDDLLAGRMDVVLSSAVVTREALEAVGPFDEDPAIFTVEDWDMWTRIGASGRRIRLLDEPLVRYRTHAQMTSHRDTRMTARKALLMLRRLHERGVLDDEQAHAAKRGMGGVLRRAGLKEGLKRIPLLKRFVYWERSVRHSAVGGGRR